MGDGSPVGRGPRRVGAPSSTWAWPLGGSLYTPPAPQGPPASRFLPRLIQHLPQARNGCLPEMTYARKLAAALNHCLAHRRKCFAAFGDYANAMAGASASTDRLRFRCHAGHAARYMTFRMGLGLADFGGAPGNTASDPRVEILIKNVASGTEVTYTTHHGLNQGGVTSDGPQEITSRTVRAPIAADTTYEVLIRTVDFGRILDIVAFEEGVQLIDPSVDYFIDSSGIAVGGAIYDSVRERLLTGLSQAWRRNGSHLITIPNLGASFASTTYANVLDDSTGTPSDASPGFWLGDSDLSMLQQTRLSGAGLMNVVIAAHGSSTVVGGVNTGRVRIQDANGTLCELGNIGAEGWYAAETTIDTATLSKCDVQASVSDAAATFVLNAVSLYCYLAG